MLPNAIILLKMNSRVQGLRSKILTNENTKKLIEFCLPNLFHTEDEVVTKIITLFWTLMIVDEVGRVYVNVGYA